MTPSPSAVRVLLVDDERPILDLLTEMLELEGYKIDTARDGAEAFDKLRSRSYDVVISDFRMPRMSGRDLYDAARRLGGGLERRFVFITGEMDPQTKREFIRETGVPVISKPFRAEAVIRVIRDTLAAVRD